MNEKEIFRISNQTNIENWYDSLKSHTMLTYFFPITIEIAQSIIKAHDALKNDNKLSEIELKSLKNLKEEIDMVISKFSSPAFVRLSTRSPKDSKKAREKSEKFFEMIYDENKNNENDRLIALVKASIQGLKISSGKEALELLVDSERVYDDLMTALEQPKDFSQKIIIRKWEVIPIDMEFRGFVHNKKLNAISQYYHYCYFPKLQEELSIIEKKIKSFFNSIKILINLDSYIIDFAILKDKIIIIELNPFFLGTDPCLFSWKTNRNIFENGPFEFRIRMDPVPNIKK